MKRLPPGSKNGGIILQSGLARAGDKLLKIEKMGAKGFGISKPCDLARALESLRCDRAANDHQCRERR